jgi:CRP-like cAMP-binding protein
MDTLKILERIDLFKGLSQEELSAVTELCEPRTYQTDEVIFAEKSKGKELYIVTKGKVRIELGIKGKTDCATVHRLGEGEVFGELVLVGEGRRSATARCETDCEVLSIAQEGLLRLFEQNARIGYVIVMKLASLLAARLKKTNLQLVSCFLWE